MGDLDYQLISQCPGCKYSRFRAYETIGFDHFACICGYTWVVKQKEWKMKFVVIRDDNNKLMTSIEQAVHVAEKLTAENPSHKYYVAKLIKESKVNSVTTIDLE